MNNLHRELAPSPTPLGRKSTKKRPELSSAICPRAASWTCRNREGGHASRPWERATPSRSIAPSDGVQAVRRAVNARGRTARALHADPRGDRRCWSAAPRIRTGNRSREAAARSPLPKIAAIFDGYAACRYRRHPSRREQRAGAAAHGRRRISRHRRPSRRSVAPCGGRGALSTGAGAMIRSPRSAAAARRAIRCSSTSIVGGRRYHLGAGHHGRRRPDNAGRRVETRSRQDLSIGYLSHTAEAGRAVPARELHLPAVDERGGCFAPDNRSVGAAGVKALPVAPPHAGAARGGTMISLVGLDRPIATMIAAMMTASNLGARVTGWGFVVYSISSVCWTNIGLRHRQASLG